MRVEEIRRLIKLVEESQINELEIRRWWTRVRIQKKADNHRGSESLAIGVRKYTGLPPFPAVPMLIFWAQRETGVDPTQIQPTVWIREISPRPVLILQGGADTYISADSGERLYQAAGEPKEYWYASGAAHHGFDEGPYCVEFERRLVGFLDRYLLGEGEKP